MSQHIEAVDVSKLKVAELKDELEKRGLETTGLKKDLAQRLRKAQDLALSGGTELAMPTEEVKDAAQPLRPTDPPMPLMSAKGATSGPRENSPRSEEVDDGVGGVMIDGAPEGVVDEGPSAAEVALRAALEPAALDRDVAAVVAAEELKDDRPPSPPIVRQASPVPASLRPEETDGPQGDEDEMAMDLGDDPVPGPSRTNEARTSSSALGKRPADASSSNAVDRSAPLNAPKRPRRTYSTPLPESLSHLLHPPTSVLYITNLRRPLLIPSLHEYVFSSPSASSSRLLPTPRAPFASQDHPGLWLSGVKDHAYAAFASIEDAIEAAERLEGRVWPEEGSASAELKVQFVPDERVEELAQEEEAAWSRGRQKLSLDIKRTGEGGDWEFTLVAAGGLGAKASTGTAASGRPAGSEARGPLVQRPGQGAVPPRGGGRPPFAPPLTGGHLNGRLGKPMQRTMHRPALAYREGPGAAR